MRWLGALAVCGACGGNPPPPVAGDVALVLDLPDGMLDPKGYTTVDLVLHEPDRDIEKSATLAGGAFDFGRIDPSASVSIEATLRNESGAAVGYGRTAMTAALAAGAEITVPVRRPIAYIAGTVSLDADGNADTPALHWTESPATFSDLSVDGNLDGTHQVAGPAVMMVAAGASLYQVTQATSDPIGALIGAASVAPVSTVDHAVGAALAGTLTGGVLDGAGADDGSVLVIGTTTQLFAVDTAAGTARALAAGSFARVAIVASDTGELTAIAIQNRGTTGDPCTATAELWWAPLAAGAAAAHMVAIGGFADVAADRGHAYYVDACNNELGELTGAAAKVLRGLGLAGIGRPTALAVSNGQAYVGIETAPATTSLIVASAGSSDLPRTLWSESAQQVLEAPGFPGVLRQLDASAAVFQHLEVGAGGDYVALTTSAHFHGDPVVEANFPDMTIDTEELRVFDAASGGVVQRYRSWCDGVLLIATGDIDDWRCASTAGQTEAADSALEHHIQSMTFQFGKK
jgi:hypothetical protein